MSRPGSAEDLLVLARQCKLDEEDERRFEVAMQSSRELACLYDAGLHFDHEAGVLSGDETRLSRLVSRALESIDRAQAGDAALAPRIEPPRSRRASPALRHFAVSLGLGLLLFASLASAWSYVEKRVASRRTSTTAHAPRARGTAGSVTRATAPALPIAPTVPAPSVAPGEDHATVTLAARPHAPAPATAPRLGAEEPLSSSELFASANQARRRGDIEAAIALYERLTRAYPGSLEAEDAKILRGNLLLIQRSPRAALREFEDYRAGALSLEALWGRAQALRKLESPDEGAVLLELVRDHPDSPYAEAARKRLRELAR